MSPVRSSTIVVTVLLYMVSVAYCQVDFRAIPRIHGLELMCSVGDLSSTSLSNLDSLLIFKITAGVRQIIASVSAHYGQSDPVSHLAGVQVNGHLSDEDHFQRYLQIVWTHSGLDLDGEYICDLNGVDTNYIPLTITQHLTVQVASMCPCFEATPEVLRVGLTKEMGLTCYIPNPPAVNISKLASLEIISIKDGIKQILAEINSVTGTAGIQGSVGTFVNGSISDINTFLQVIWEYPSAALADEYVCEGSGVGINGAAVFFSKYINVSLEEPEPGDLIQRLFEMYREQNEYLRCREALDMLTNTYKPYISSVTPTDVPSSAKIMHPKRCDDLILNVGQHIVTIEPDDGLGPIQVLCQCLAPNETWTVFQKRFNGSVDFYRSFSEYRDGFGSVDGEFWLGLKNVRRLLLQNGDHNQLRFDLAELTSSRTYTKTYSGFSLGPGDGYILNITGHIDDDGYGISSDVGQNFSTYDHGYTMIANESSRAAGWWFPLSGGYVNINGRWGLNHGLQSMTWYEFKFSWANPLGSTEMKFRHNNS